MEAQKPSCHWTARVPLVSCLRNETTVGYTHNSYKRQTERLKKPACDLKGKGLVKSTWERSLHVSSLWVCVSSRWVSSGAFWGKYKSRSPSIPWKSVLLSSDHEWAHEWRSERTVFVWQWRREKEKEGQSEGGGAGMMCVWMSNLRRRLSGEATWSHSKKEGICTVAAAWLCGLQCRSPVCPPLCSR